jgi:protein-disulfide isomerase
MSPYGSFHGVPVALLGVIWFVFVALLVIWGTWGPRPLQDNFPGYLFAVSTVGLAAILYLAYAAFFVLKAICVLCLATYVGVIGLFVVSGIVTPFPMTTLPRRILGDLKALVKSPVALLVAALFAAGSASAIAYFPREVRQPAAAPAPSPQAQTDMRSEIERFMATAPRQALPVSAPGAVVLIVKFSDYQCPSCAATFFAYKPILAKYEAQFPGAVKLVTKDFPLNSNCNRSVPGVTHPASCDAAVAVALAKRNHREAEMEDWLFTNQSQLTPYVVRQAASAIGRVADWDAAYPRALEQVKGDAALGGLLHINFTPTFFVNGVEFVGAFTSPDLFDAVIAYELRRAGKIK